MKQRCGYVKGASKRSIKFYKNITVCDEWMAFEPFYEWAKDKYKKGLDIDRIDTLNGYSPDNCRFITRKRNTQNNKRSKIWVVYGKQFDSSSDAANFFGCCQSHIYFLCHGRKTKTKNYYPEPFCYSVRKYLCQK
jgi:hypothetical protein